MSEQPLRVALFGVAQSGTQFWSRYGDALRRIIRHLGEAS